MSKVFQTPNKSYLLTGSGTAAMEAAIANTVAPGEKMLNVVCGKFGERFMKIAKTHGIDAQELAVEWGTAVTPKQIEEALDADENGAALARQYPGMDGTALVPGLHHHGRLLRLVPRQESRQP